MTWNKIPSIAVTRSSHSFSIVGNKGYIFGGEIEPRNPVGNDVVIVDLSTGETTSVLASGDAPEPRVGHTAATIGNDVYIFGGRGGPAMTPLEEGGSIYRFSTVEKSWTKLEAHQPYPCARSYHCSTSTPTSIIVHAGCGNFSTGRLRDTWSFDIASNQWTQLADAPGDPRGGAAIAYTEGSLWRFGGFNGKTEMGGEIDFLDLNSGFKSVTWDTISFDHQIQGSFPENRSVSGLVALSSKLVLLFGEGRPSPTGGHDAAGNFWGDVWAFETKTKLWKEIEQGDNRPAERGWFACDVMKGGLAVWGGVDVENKRLGDGWVLKQTE